MTFDTERRALADACRRLASEGLVIGTAGNLSVRAGDRVVVTPTGCVLSEVSPDDMAVVDLDGGVQDGGPAPTSELGLHLGVYRRFDWSGGVVHTHSPMATALGCVLDELPPIHYQMLALGGAVRVAPYATFGSDELHDHVLAALEGHTAALMQNHGTLTCGTGLDSAVEATLLLEWACSLYWHASQVGEPSVLSDEQLADVAAQVQRLSYGAARA
ncbi:MAG: L-fuculose-phosphate aldolase [Thermoleophilaceae bacterium]|nr:L-fuculose-phosphate aldolase [Thermoleophilaceae bacterium]